jgi:amidase
VYGHKPTLELVSLRGHASPPLDADVRVTSDLSVAGPMARSAADLAAALRIVGGQDGYDEVAWKWSLPAPRQKQLKDFRIGVPPDDRICPVSSDVKAVLDTAMAALRKAGAKIERGWPPGVDATASLETYRTLLGANMYSRLPAEQLEPMHREWERNPRDPMLNGVFAPHKSWVMQAANQRTIRFAWQEYFKTRDVFLMPVAFAPAMLKDESEPLEARKIATPDGPRDYTDLVIWVSFATLAGLPATSAPVGRTRAGLPVGLQIMGPMWEDATTIEFAARLADVTGGFERPKGY